MINTQKSKKPNTGWADRSALDVGHGLSLVTRIWGGEPIIGTFSGIGLVLT